MHPFVGMAFRVPVVDVSVVDLTCRLGTPTTLDQIAAVVQRAGGPGGSMEALVGVTDLPLVSADFRSVPILYSAAWLPSCPPHGHFRYVTQGGHALMCAGPRGEHHAEPDLLQAGGFLRQRGRLRGENGKPRPTCRSNLHNIACVSRSTCSCT